jgi:uncharacterized protein (DUF885 family)
MPITVYEGPHLRMPKYVLPKLRLATGGDYENYIRRLEAFPKQVG